MVDCCIIIPCFNEANRLDIETFKTFQKQNNAINLLFANDGSTDNTFAVLNSLNEKLPNVSILNFEKNSGKAETIRKAVLQTNKKYNYIGYLDADLSTSLSEISRLLNIAKTKNKTFVLGSRVKVLGASIKRKFYRHFFGRMVATFIDSLILKLDIYDTQCGAKIIQSDLALSIFKEPFKTKWLFDVELLARTKKLHGKAYCKSNIIEVPLNQWHDTKDTRISFIDFLKTPFALLKLYSNYAK
ncbi:glycosyl transferase family 2 [Lacinutrix venerupis]|uniref:glycosyltransferase n=1 Tax=Lacinutrix venerupis TaxID=1486034 RepID=UPI000EAC3912|nr:glycosyltransferase [Lacinutrix venerupis]RLJ67118.1 glycosyl transferase family 2 [Lacinutrix venerupis]